MKNMRIGQRYGEQGNAREISSLLCARSVHSVRSSPNWWPVHARKNAQVATNLETSCNKSVHKLLTSCVACFKLSEQIGASFVETPRKFIIAELSIRKLGSSSVLIIPLQ